MLDGDGMVLRFAFGESQAQAPSSLPAPSSSACAFTSRFVRTTEFRAEEAADAIVYRGTFGTMRAGGFAANALDLHQKNLANTNILAWGDRVYALYEAGRPVALDPVTLDAAGEDDLDGKLPPGMFVSAGAPRVGTRARTRRRRVHRPPTRRFAHGARRRVGLEEPRGESRGGGYVLGVGGGLVRADDADDVSPRRMRGGAARLRRDPIVVRPRAELSQGQPGTVPRRAARRGGVSGESARGSRHRAPRASTGFGLRRRRARLRSRARRRRGTEGVVRDPRRVRARRTAHRRGRGRFRGGGEGMGDVLHRGVGRVGAGFVPRRVGGFGRVGFPDGDETLSGFQQHPADAPVAVSRGGGDGEGASRARARVREPVHRSPARQPAVRGSTRVSIRVRVAVNEVGRSGPPLGYVRVDLRTGETQKWWAGNRSFCEEVVIVPKDGARVGDDDAAPERAREEECWILGMIADHSEGGEGKSSLVILDGANLAAGPVARVWLEHRIPHGLHGAFVHAERT